MENTDKLEFLREVVNKPAGELTKSDLADIRAIAQEHGVGIARKGCPSCYIDAAVELFGKLGKEQGLTQTVSRKLREGVDVTINGVRFCEATMTDDKIAMLERLGLTQYLQ